MSTLQILIGLAVIAAGAVPLSMLVESLRRQPATPEKFYWDNSIPVQYVTIDGTKIRYIKVGQGPNLVLLHTLRTQLDIFQKMIPQLARDFTIYAMDYPGHGFSDIPDTDYVPELFISAVEKFLDELNIENTTLAGISIGGSIPSLIAAKHNQRVKKVISINPYDYGKGKSAERGNFPAWLLFTLMRIPVVGETVMRFRIKIVERLVMQGGVASADALPEEFLQQIWESGVRRGHYRSFINLVRHAYLWEEARPEYLKINIPVLLIYGDKDWSRENERERNLAEIPGAKLVTIKNGGHFLSLDCPEELIELIRKN